MATKGLTPVRGPKKKVVVVRLDEGGSKDKGHFKCLAEGCGWERKDVSSPLPYCHVKDSHPGCEYTKERAVASCRKRSRESDEIRKEKNRVRMAEQRRKTKEVSVLTNLSFLF